MRLLINVAVTAVIICVVLLLLLFFAQSRLIYFPDTEFIGTPDEVGLGHESVEIATTDNETLHGWFVPVPATTADKPTVLFFHGNTGNISHRIDYLTMLAELGYATLIFDYRGYGRSSGSPSESGTYLDAQAAWRYLTETKGVPPGRVVLFGESLGGAVAAWLAAREKPGALVLASTFTSVPDMAAKIYPFLPVRLLSRFGYNTLEYLRSVTSPVFVAHSPQDEIVPFTQGLILFQAAPEPKQFLELQGGHNDGFIFRRKSWAMALGEFIDSNLN